MLLLLLLALLTTQPRTHARTHPKELRVIVQIMIIESQPHFLIDSLQSRSSFLHDGNGSHRLRRGSTVKGRDWSGVLLLRHAIVQHGLDCRQRCLRERFLQEEPISPR